MHLPQQRDRVHYPGIIKHLSNTGEGNAPKKTAAGPDISPTACMGPGWEGERMKGQEVCFSKESDEWETPQDLYDRLDREFHFVLDAAATAGNTKCPPKYLSIEFGVDALTINWCYHSQGRPIWLNPPYSKIAAFIKKAYEESQKGCTVVCLIPSRTDTKYWHDYVMMADEVRFIKGRLKFNGGKSGAPFPSCVVVFRESTGPNRPGPIMIGMEARV